VAPDYDNITIPIKTTDITESTSTTTGSGIFAGGLGVAKDIYCNAIHANFVDMGWMEFKDDFNGPTISSTWVQTKGGTSTISLGDGTVDDPSCVILDSGDNECSMSFGTYTNFAPLAHNFICMFRMKASGITSNHWGSVGLFNASNNALLAISATYDAGTRWKRTVHDGTTLTETTIYVSFINDSYVYWLFVIDKTNIKIYYKTTLAGTWTSAIADLACSTLTSGGDKLNACVPRMLSHGSNHTIIKADFIKLQQDRD
jgi:hypothetical protein